VNNVKACAGSHVRPSANYVSKITEQISIKFDIGVHIKSC